MSSQPFAEHIFVSFKDKIQEFFSFSATSDMKFNPHVPPRANCNKGVTTPKRYVASVSFSKIFIVFKKIFKKYLCLRV